MSENESPIIIDHERQQKAKEYSRINRRHSLASMVVMGLYFVLWLFTGWGIDLRRWIETYTQNPWLTTPVFALLFMLPYSIIDIPWSYHTGFVLPHRYDQSNQSLKDWVDDQIKGLLISGILGLLVLEIIYGFLRSAPELWWLYAGIFMLFFTVILSNLAPVLIMPLFYKFVPLEDEELTSRLVRLAEQANATVKGVYRFDMSSKTKSANAAVMGLGNTRRIVLGDTLLDEFTHDEIETVLAHELGHHVHKDIVLGITINSIETILMFWIAGLVIQWGVEILGLHSVGDPASLPLFALITGILGFISMPLGNAYSRWRERLADQYALDTTGKNQAFISAMTRLANQNLADIDPEAWVVWLLHSHPPIKERIAFAQSYNDAEL